MGGHGAFGTPYEEDFQKALKCLRAYAAREGDARVPRTHKEDGFPLGTVGQSADAESIKREQLSKERIKALEKLCLGGLGAPFGTPPRLLRRLSNISKPMLPEEGMHGCLERTKRMAFPGTVGQQPTPRV